jgi:hypothetical protein
MKKILLFCISFLLLSCSEQGKNENKIKTVFFDKFSDVSPSEILEQSFIKLETTDDCLLGYFDQIAFVKNRLLILYQDKIIVFDKNGSYITQINRKGQGPGEYSSIESFFINEKDNLICLIAGSKLLSFNLDNFQFISGIRMPFSSFYASFLPDGNIIWNNRGYLSKGVNNYFVKTDTSLNVIGSYLEKPFVSGYITGEQKTIYSLKEEIFAYTPFSPVIYKVSQDSVLPAFQLSIYERQFPSTQFLQDISADNAIYFGKLEQSDYVSHFLLEENENDMCLFYIAKEQRFVALYDKKNQKSYHYTFDEFQNDLQTGNIFTYLAPGKVGDYYVMPLIPSELKAKKEDGYSFREPLNSLMDKSMEDDNPILFLFKLSNKEIITK